MKRYDVSDCIAMSEDADWYAFPGGFTRAEVIGALTEPGERNWYDVLRAFSVSLGYVVQGIQDGSAWYWEAEAKDVGAIPCWIARRR